MGVLRAWSSKPSILMDPLLQQAVALLEEGGLPRGWTWGQFGKAAAPRLDLDEGVLGKGWEATGSGEQK